MNIIATADLLVRTFMENLNLSEIINIVYAC